MSTRTSLHRLALAGAVAAMLASAAPGAFAQTTDTPAPPATTTPDATMPPAGATATPDATTPPAGTMTTPPSTGTDSTTPAPMSGSTSPAPMSGSTSSMPMSGTASTNVPTPPMNLPTDYSVLNNRIFDATNLEQARARGLSDSQIATIIKISRETSLSFNQVSGMVERGESFPAIATRYNLRLADVYNIDKEKQQVSDYDALNKYAKSLGKSDSDMMSMPMSGGSSSTTPPMTPADSTTPMAPASQLDIIQTASAAKNLTTFVKAVQIAGLTETLQGTGPFTVFAPDDKAFAKLPAGALDALEADPAKLKAVLTYHVIPANIMAADAMAMTSPTSPPTVEGATLQVTKGKKGKLKVNDATVTKADIRASNGTIHIINMVLMPPTTDTTTASPGTTDTTTPPATGTTTPPAAPMDATPPAAPATPGTTDATPPAAPAAPGTTDAPPAAPATPGTPGATDPAPVTPGTTATPPAAPATPGQ